MTETETPPAGGTPPAPQLHMVSQYVRDLSFENPMSGEALSSAPEIQVRVNVAANTRGDDRYEAILKLEAEAKVEGKSAFMVSCDYGGIFTITNADPRMLEALVMIECPRLLFPFARRVMADATRDGGYPPLMLDPIDFVALYKQQAAQRAAAQQQAGGPNGTA